MARSVTRGSANSKKQKPWVRRVYPGDEDAVVVLFDQVEVLDGSDGLGHFADVFFGEVGGDVAHVQLVFFEEELLVEALVFVHVLVELHEEAFGPLDLREPRVP